MKKNYSILDKLELVIVIMFFITLILPLSAKINKLFNIFLLGELKIYTFDFILFLVIILQGIRLIKKRNFNLNQFEGNYLLMIFVGLTAISTFLGVSVDSVSINDFLIWPRVLFIFVYFQNTEVFDKNKDIFKWVIYSLVVFLLIISFVQIATKSEMGSLVRYIGDSTGVRQGSWDWFRVKATFHNTNIFGQVMLILLAWVYFNYLHEKDIISLAILIFGAVAVFFTSSRGLILALLAMFPAGAVIYAFKKNVKMTQIFIKSVILLVCFSLVFGFIFNDFFLKNITRFKAIFNYKESKSLYSRIFYIQLGSQIIKDYPFWGIGFHNLSHVIHDYYQQIPKSVAFTDDTSIHNILFLLLSETGIISTLVFLLFFWRLVLIYLKNNNNIYMQYGLLILFLYFINSLWYMSPFNSYILMLFFSINGLLINFNTKTNLGVGES